MFGINQKRVFASAATAALVFAATANADVVWDEAIDGSLSTDRFNTTDFGTLAVGSNNAIGSTVSGISKFFTFTISEGTEFSALVVDGWESLDDLGFLGIVEGDFFDVDPAAPDVTQLLGYYHYGLEDIGLDILPAMGAAPGAQGFDAPLGPGTYSFWVRQGGPDIADWNLNFVVTPTPGAIAILALGGFAGTRRRQ